MAEICTGAYTVMDDAIIISNLNDFIFCPASIYFHNLYGSRSTITYQNSSQMNGSNVHEAIDNGNYTSQKNILTSIDVYCEKYNLIGKIDIYNMDNKTQNQRKALMKLRNKTELTKESVQTLDGYLGKLRQEKLGLNSILGIEGSAARVYFPQMFDNTKI